LAFEQFQLFLTLRGHWKISALKSLINVR